MHTGHRLIWTVAIVVALGAGLASADPILWDENGHYYQLIETPVTWHEADYLSNQMEYMGRQGHLATITSQAENDFVYWTVVGGNQDTPMGDPWLGGYQNSDQSPPADNWHWVTDEPWSFVNWDEGEPNDFDDPYAEMFLNFQLWGDGFWNDHHSLNLKAFVVEFSDNVVPVEQKTFSDVRTLFR